MALKNRYFVGNVMILMLMVSSMLMIPERLWLLGVAVSVYAVSIGMGKSALITKTAASFRLMNSSLPNKR